MTAERANPLDGEHAIGSDVFVARQPIFSRRRGVYGYELLFRHGLELAFGATDGNAATSSVIETGLLNIGLDQLTGGRPAFINFTRDLLLTQEILRLPRKQIVIEILETVAPEPDILEACEELRRRGFTLALDDYAFQEGTSRCSGSPTSSSSSTARCSPPTAPSSSTACAGCGCAASSCSPRRSRPPPSTTRPSRAASSSSRVSSGAAARPSPARRSRPCPPHGCGSCSRSRARPWTWPGSRTSSSPTPPSPFRCCATSTPVSSAG